MSLPQTHLPPMLHRNLLNLPHCSVGVKESDTTSLLGVLLQPTELGELPAMENLFIHKRTRMCGTM